MDKALSTDLRRRVVDATAQGMSCRQAAEGFSVCISSLSVLKPCQTVQRLGDIEMVRTPFPLISLERLKSGSASAYQPC
jgi:hypothetical protein